MYNSVWFLGDGFLEITFDKYFRDIRSQDGKLDDIQAHYDTLKLCHGYNNNQVGNILKRLRNLFVEAINNMYLLPKAVVIVLDDDMLDEFNHYKSGLTTGIGKMVEWIVNEIHEIITDYKEDLPSKSHKFKYPTVLWCLIPLHQVYDHYNEFKTKFNNAIIRMVKLFREMNYLQLSKWNEEDTTYFTAGQINPIGLAVYWNAINSAFEAWDRDQLRFKGRFHEPQCSLSQGDSVSSHREKTLHAHGGSAPEHNQTTHFHRERQGNYDKYH